jgi:hypothetical protein
MLRNDVFSLSGSAQDIKPQALADSIVATYQQRSSADGADKQFLLKLNHTLEVRSGGSTQHHFFNAAERVVKAVFFSKDHQHPLHGNIEAQEELARRWINLRVLFQVEDKIRQDATHQVAKPGMLPTHVIVKEDQGLLYFATLAQVADVNWLERNSLAPITDWAKIREVVRRSDPAQRQDSQPNNAWGRLGAVLDDATKLHKVGLTPDYTIRMAAAAMQDIPVEQRPIERLKHLIAHAGDGLTTPAGKFFNPQITLIRNALEIDAAKSALVVHAPSLAIVVPPLVGAVLESQRPVTPPTPGLSSDGITPVH